jgi:gamma-glutamyl hercynylcysteine S-oxide synthase
MPQEAAAARGGDAATLAGLLLASRRDTLATFAAFERALPGLEVPRRDELNPPLWELGHIGWFQSYWLARYPARGNGAAADPQAPRQPPVRPDADALYDSSHVPHDTRWALPLPGAAQTRAELAAQLAQTLALLQALQEVRDESDQALYFHRLVLLHEDMHHEAALYMAQALGVPIDDPRWFPAPLPAPPAALAFAATNWTLGSAAPQGFAFDNELGQKTVRIAPYQIDAQAVRWAEYLPFVEAGGAAPPRYLQRDGSRWLRRRHGRWAPLDLAEAACHLTLQEAEAWCRWAGRRLPTEAEWERAALTEPERFAWGAVWEWTASRFEPFDGFVPHPYRDYSAPWFDGRPVLRGASFMTQPRMRHPRYRNFFGAHRNDVPAGFRSCR